MPTILAKGKTKEIVEVPKNDDPRLCSTCEKVAIVSNDFVTAGDGAAKEEIPGKGEFATITTTNVFKLLKGKGVPTHFLDRDPVEKNIFYALKAKMIPLEVVVRRFADYSYLARHPEVPEGQVFCLPEFELFFKDDLHHDPYVVLAPHGKGCSLYLSDRPVSQKSALGYRPFFRNSPEIKIDFAHMRIIALQVFQILEEAWKQQGVTLHDLKIEFGLVPDGTGGLRLVVADVIDNDSWRITDVSGRQLDKQVFRDAVKRGVTRADLKEVESLYSQVAESTNKFVKLAHVV